MCLFCAVWFKNSSAVKSVVTDFIAPFLVKEKALGKKLENSYLLSKSKIELIKEVERITREQQITEVNIKQLTALARQNEELREILNLSSQVSYSFLAAEIISADPASAGRRVRIDRGSDDGVVVGQPVIANGVFYGRILEVSKHTALILTVYDPNCKVSVRVAGTNLHGIMIGDVSEQWKSAPRCKIQYLPRDQTYSEGMIVETSALGSVTPAAIPVGKLVADVHGSVATVIDNLYKEATIQPINFNENIKFVLVLTIL